MQTLAKPLLSDWFGHRLVAGNCCAGRDKGEDALFKCACTVARTGDHFHINGTDGDGFYELPGDYAIKKF